MISTAWFERHYRALSALVLVLAAFNLGFRLDREVVTEWDEALYATSASEAVASGDWIGTTLRGDLDYYNTKPPLNLWLIGLSFKTFGASLWSLRLASVLAAWLTILVLLLWVRRSFGAATAIAAGVVLSTTFGFLYVHSGRSANTDAFFTLLTLLTVVTAWASEDRPWRLCWLGPLAAALFLLRGMGVLMPLAMVFITIVFTRERLRERRASLAVAGLLAVLFIAPWAVARWQLDGWRFFSQIVWFDFLMRSLTVLEEHSGTPLFYLNELQANQYEWLTLAVAAALLYRAPWTRWSAILFGTERHLRIIIASWAGVALLLPTLMQTKLPWYLNPFFPLFALVVARVVAYAFSQSQLAGGIRRTCLVAVAVLALGVAEGKLLWYSWHMRDLGHSVQGLLLSEPGEIAGRRVFHTHWNLADRFVCEHLAGATCLEVADVAQFMREGQVGDYWVGDHDPGHPELVSVSTNARYGLYLRLDQDPGAPPEGNDARNGWRSGGRGDRMLRGGGRHRGPGGERGRGRRRGAA